MTMMNCSPPHKVAVVGDVHGKFNLLYDLIQKHTPDVCAIITAGDLEPVRTIRDYDSTKISGKYRDMCRYEFADYYTGSKKIPIPTYFIGGNHEPNAFLKELSEGLVTVPNLHFIGYHGQIQIGQYVFGGISGNYSSKHFKTARSALSLRNYRHFLKEDLDYIEAMPKLDFLMTHDWPQGLDTAARRMFPCLSPELRVLVEKKQPRVMFGGHMHFSLEANINSTSFYGLAILKEETKPILNLFFNDLEFILYG